jgi:outer membrane protein assembly factor BamD
MKRFLLSLLFIHLIVSCSTERPSGKTEAEVVYREAKELIADGRFLMAIEKLNLIRSKYPYSYYATHAELLNADVLFAQENYVEAAAAYIVFKDFHPKHAKMNYVIWRIAESFYFQLPSTFDRDLAPGHEAVKYYKDLIRNFPDSEYVKEAKDKIISCQTMFRQKEQYIADFYFKTEVYDSARFRYLSILSNFSDKALIDHSIERVLKSSYYLKDKKACKKHFYELENQLSSDKKENFLRVFKECMELKDPEESA